MEGNLPLLRSATVELFKRLLPDDVARSARSDTRSRSARPSPANVDELNAALPTAIAPNALTPLWRALPQAIEAFGDATTRAT